ncbi:MAG: ATP phosphoribosyltransferase [Pseudomonadota bacterium]|jgi:ATP phosphoribosyltransferase|nr:ATP phosphoribosyltransferase [Pseudomonadota bacterium]
MERQDVRIKIAVQKSGRLTDHSMELLVRCGLSYSKGRDQLICYGENMPVDVLLVRDDDIPSLVQENVCDLGIVGLNIVEERRLGFKAQGADDLFEIAATLDFGHCRLSFAVPDEISYTGPQSLQGMKVATTYPHIVKSYLETQDIDGTVVEFSGAVEIAPSLGRADLICDLVSSGETLRAHNLQEVDTILESTATLIRTSTKPIKEKAEWIQRLLQRIHGVLQVRESKYIMLHAPRNALEEIRSLLPGSEAPTIIPLEGCDDKVAIHAVCRENIFWETLEELKEAGASSMLVIPVEKMLA